MNQKVLRQLLAARRRALERHQQTRLHLRLSSIELDGGQSVPQLHRFLAQRRYQFGRLALAGPGIDAEQPAVSIAVSKGVDRIYQPPLLTNLLEQARRHAAAERSRQHRGSVIVGVTDHHAGKADDEVQLFEIPLLAMITASVARRL